MWKGTVMIITYDEHGGFFDHVSPPFLRTDPPAGAHYTRPFETLGVRVPAFVISPFVKPRSVFNQCFDHTSILKFIGQKFGRDGSYSKVVDKRAVASALDVLDPPNDERTALAIPSLEPYLQKEPPRAGFVAGTAPGTPLQHAFQNALDNIRRHPDKSVSKFNGLLAAFPQRS
jgi:phospholipase C